MDIEYTQAKKEYNKQKEEDLKELKEHEENRRHAFNDMAKAIEEEGTTFGTLEDICMNNGVDMDEIEDFLLSY